MHTPAKTDRLATDTTVNEEFLESCNFITEAKKFKFLKTLSGT